MRIKPALLCIFYVLSTYAVAQEESTDYSGVWQDVSGSHDYYVIQERGDSVLLIALPGIEASADTLRYSYMADMEELLFNRLSSDAPADDIYRVVQMHFSDSETASILPVCDACKKVIQPPTD